MREFHLPDDSLAVYRLPGHYQDFLDNPSAPYFDQEMRQAYPESIARWRKEGRFVLEWGNDYWLDNSGEVTDS